MCIRDSFPNNQNPSRNNNSYPSNRNNHYQNNHNSNSQRNPNQGNAEHYNNNNNNRNYQPNNHNNNNRVSRPMVHFIRAEENGPRREQHQRENDSEHLPRSNSIGESRSGSENQRRDDPSRNVRIVYNQQNPPERWIPLRGDGHRPSTSQDVRQETDEEETTADRWNA